MTDGPRTTVLVVAFGHAAWIEQCLDSCKVQTAPVHVVVLDDASGDGTPDVVRAWSARTGTAVQLIAHEQNVGLGPSLVEALATVGTEFFAYIAGDDWMEPDRVAAQVAAFDEAGDECVLVYADCYRADADGTRFDELFSAGLGAGWRPQVRDAFSDLLDENWIPAPSVMIRTAALRAVGGYDPTLFYEDHDAYLRLARAGSFRCIERPLATHRELTTSLGHRMFFYEDTADEWNRARIQIYLKHLGRSGARDRDIAQRVAVWALQLYRHGAQPRDVAGWLGPVRPFLEHGRGRFTAFWLLARIGVPGRRLP